MRKKLAGRNATLLTYVTLEEKSIKMYLGNLVKDGQNQNLNICRYLRTYVPKIMRFANCEMVVLCRATRLGEFSHIGPFFISGIF
jgi:hypothetical protein